jgi:hypothetical protein
MSEYRKRNRNSLNAYHREYDRKRRVLRQPPSSAPA